MLLQQRKARHGIGKLCRFDDLAFLGFESTEATSLAPDIDADYIGKGRGIHWRRGSLCWIHQNTSRLIEMNQSLEKVFATYNGHADQPERASTHAGLTVFRLLPHRSRT